MLTLHHLKKLSLALGVYRPVRAAHRALFPGQRKRFRDDVTFYRSLLPEGCLCFDVGANIGAKAEVLLAAGARVIAVEPQVDCLREAMARCKRYRRVVFEPVGVGAKVGVSKLHRHAFRAHSSFLHEWEGKVEDSIEVPMTTLEQLIGKYGAPHYCKVDVEGWELEVLRGLAQRIPLVSFEYHLRDRDIQTTLACIRHLATLGELRINVAPAERLELAYDPWLPLDRFHREFPSAFVGKAGFDYGDVFVRIEDGAPTAVDGAS